MNDDIILYICRYLNNRQKVQFLSMTVSTHELKSKTRFTGQVILSRISKLSYFDRFERVFVDQRGLSLPSNTKILDTVFTRSLYSIGNLSHLKYITHITVYNLSVSDFINCLPKTFTHLSIKYAVDFGEIIIPSSVTHLSLLDVKEHILNIPKTVRYLTIDKCMYNSIEFPPELIHLNMKSYWNSRPITELPNKLTHLRINYRYEDTFVIPSSVIYLQLKLEHRGSPPDIPFGIKKLILSGASHICRLPESIKYLRIDTETSYSNMIFVIPSSVRRLELCQYDYDRISKDRPGLKIKKLK